MDSPFGFFTDTCSNFTYVNRRTILGQQLLTFQLKQINIDRVRHGVKNERTWILRGRIRPTVAEMVFQNLPRRHSGYQFPDSSASDKRFSLRSWKEKAAVAQNSIRFYRRRGKCFENDLSRRAVLPSSPLDWSDSEVHRLDTVNRFCGLGVNWFSSWCSLDHHCVKRQRRLKRETRTSKKNEGNRENVVSISPFVFFLFFSLVVPSLSLCRFSVSNAQSEKNKLVNKGSHTTWKSCFYREQTHPKLKTDDVLLASPSP